MYTVKENTTYFWEFKFNKIINIYLIEEIYSSSNKKANAGGYASETKYIMNIHHLSFSGK